MTPEDNNTRGLLGRSRVWHKTARRGLLGLTQGLGCSRRVTDNYLGDALLLLLMLLLMLWLLLLMLWLLLLLLQMSIDV